MILTFHCQNRFTLSLLVCSLIYMISGCDKLKNSKYDPEIKPIKYYTTINSDVQGVLSKNISFVVSPAPNNSEERKIVLNKFIESTRHEILNSTLAYREVYISYKLYKESDEISENFEPKNNWLDIAISPNSGDIKNDISYYGKGYHLADIRASYVNCKLGFHVKEFRYFF